jgi:transcriptional regulator with XRE-family HTH domain
MEMPPWHIGHVIRKLMMVRDPELTRTRLAELAQVRPMTITHMLKGGTSDPDTLEAVCRVLGVSEIDIKSEVQRSNAGSTNLLQMPNAEQRRRLTDRDQLEIDAEQYARRLLRLQQTPQMVVYNTIRAFEEAYAAASKKPTER